MTSMPGIDALTLQQAVPARGLAAMSAPLIARCLEGDERAFALLYDQYAMDIHRLCYSMLQHREDAEEVLQDAFEYAFRRLHKYDPGKASFRTWLYRIAISRCRNKRRRKWLPTFSLSQVAPEIIEDRQILAPAAAVQLTDEQNMVWTALRELSPKLRETTVLRYYGGLSYKEIGEIVGVSHKTVESRMRLAHKRLKELLESMLEGEAQ